MERFVNETENETHKTGRIYPVSLGLHGGLLMPWQKGRRQKELWERAREVKYSLAEEIKEWLGLDPYELRSLYYQLKSVFDVDWDSLSPDLLECIDKEVQFLRDYWGLSYAELLLLYDALRLIYEPFYSQEKIQYAEEILEFIRKR